MSEVSGSGQPQPSQSGAGAEQLFEQVQSRLTQLQMDPLPDKRAATQKVAQLSTINVYLNWLLLAQECNIEVAPQNLLKATQMRGECSRSAPRCCGKLSMGVRDFCAVAEMKRLVQQPSCCRHPFQSLLHQSGQTATKKSCAYGTWLGPASTNRTPRYGLSHWPSTSTLSATPKTSSPECCPSSKALEPASLACSTKLPRASLPSRSACAHPTATVCTSMAAMNNQFVLMTVS